jgi:hypothetical protein
MSSEEMNGFIDWITPLEIGFQEQVSNHLQTAAVKSRW